MNWIDEKQTYVAEVANFWDEVSKHLPRSVERSALGDDKIFQAVNIAYQKMRPYIIQKGTQEALAKVDGKIPEMRERFGRFIRETNHSAVNTENGYNLACDDLLHHLQQLKDNNKTV